MTSDIARVTATAGISIYSHSELPTPSRRPPRPPEYLSSAQVRAAGLTEFVDELRNLPVYGRRGRIAWLVEHLEMSQDAFGKHVGRNRETVNAWVNARQTTDRTSARRIAELANDRLDLDCSWQDFYEEAPDPLLAIRESVDALRDTLAADREHKADPIGGLTLLVAERFDPEAAALVADELEAAAEGFHRLARALRARVAAPDR